MYSIHNAVPEIVMRFPLLKDESLYGVLNSYGMYCDRVFYEEPAGEGARDRILKYEEKRQMSLVKN